jgi:hypothetical protein
VAEGGSAVEPFDPTRPNIARVWDYWLGGKENFAADRELAQKMLAVHPVSAQMARENRRFLGRAVSAVAARGEHGRDRPAYGPAGAGGVCGQ